MKRVVSIALIAIAFLGTTANAFTMTPDGEYVSGDSFTMTPEGDYVGGSSFEMTPDGNYVGSN